MPTTFKILVILLLAGIIGSLFSGLFFLTRDSGDKNRTVRALTIRISLSVLLFLLLLFGYFAGYLQPHGVGR